MSTFAYLRKLSFMFMVSPCISSPFYFFFLSFEVSSSMSPKMSNAVIIPPKVPMTLPRRFLLLVDLFFASSLRLRSSIFLGSG